ncbi:ABC transporter substrate-binding protein [Proteiniborus sp. MB09-C3]|uniref:ABC transporter substrate-binding protein n=1 Tax=Proteiniborus sp. MB09-C3 TaxID=3050072 RepID=UPI002552CB2B|nr:ABC transporter substrate-binding protein [Proteiniborus sp. MB09-C3]WIV12640.1 ABC transporter substrate-binding protein [Proteiniborus sp. MB09-C3]
MNKFKRHISILLAVFMLVALFSGCSNQNTVNPEKTENLEQKQEQPLEAKTKVVTNLDGTKIEVPVNVERVAALFGPSYEKVYILNAEDKIVAAGDFHKNGWPWSNVIYKKLDSVVVIENAHSSLNIEDLLKYEPQVVFYFPNPNAVASINKAGMVAVPMASTGKFEDTKDVLTLYADILGGEAVEIAKKYAEYFDEKVKMVTDITSQIPKEERPDVYFSNQEILWTAGKSSDIVEVIELAGGNCVHKDIEGGSKNEITIEQLLSWNPDYIFVDHAGSSGNASAEEVIDEMLDDEQYQNIKAIKNDNIYISPTGVFFWDSGQQKILMLMWMAKELYPEKFSNIDMLEELKYFYKEFYRYDLTDEETDKILRHLNP